MSPLLILLLTSGVGNFILDDGAQFLLTSNDALESPAQPDISITPIPGGVNIRVEARIQFWWQQ